MARKREADLLQQNRDEFDKKDFLTQQKLHLFEVKRQEQLHEIRVAAETKKAKMVEVAEMN